MQSQLHGRVRMAFGANSFGFAVRIVIQVLQVPLFLSMWSSAKYGEWVILSTLPAFLALSDLGMSNAGANVLCKEIAQSNRPQARRVFWAIWLSIASVSVLLCVFCGAVCASLGAAKLGFKAIHGREYQLAIVGLCSCVMFRLQFSALSAVYTGFGRYGEFDFIDNAAQLAEFAAMALAIIVTKDAGSVAIALSLLRLTALLFAWRRLRQHEAWIFVPIFSGTVAELRRMAVPATMFMIFPLGNAISTQGFTTLVSYTFGPVAVVSFTTIRTFVRVSDQLISIIYRFVQPEIAIASGAESFETMRKLHRISVKLCVLVSLVAGIVLVTIGTRFYSIWTLGRFRPDYGLIFLFLAGTIIRSIWYTSAMVVSGLNRHTSMAVFFFSVTVLSLGVGVFLARSTGSLLSVAAATLLADISLLWYVPRRALALTQDRPIIFFGSFFLSDDYLLIFRTSLKLLHLNKSVAAIRA